MRTTDKEAHAEALECAEALSSFWQDRLGDRLLGFYLLGSLAHGSFNRRYSDIDVGLVAEDGLADTDIDAMRAESATFSPELAPKLSLFWTDRRFSVGRFPPLDRLDYLDHAVPLVERERIEPARPSIDEVHTYLRAAPLENWKSTVARFVQSDVLDAIDHKPYLRAHLYPARFAFSWLTGRMVSNDDAIAFLHTHPPEGLDLALLDKALQCRHDARDPDGLFGDREKLCLQVEACQRLMLEDVEGS